LELGLAPARVDILKTRLFFLKYILDQEEESMIHKFLTLQIENPTRFDWASTCISDLKDLEIQLSFSDIKNMTENGYKEIV
jgi:virulence-associated protein VapD